MAEKLLVTGTTKSRVRYLLKDIFLYGAASALVPFVGLIAVPLLTYRLSVAEYGAFELVLSYIGVAVIIGGAGQDSAFARYYYDHDHNDDSRRQIINQAFWTQLVTSLLIACIFITVGHHLFDRILSISNFQLLVYCAAVSIPSIVGFNFVRNVLKWTFMQKGYVLATFLYAGLVLVGYYISVVLLDLGTIGAVMAQSVGAFIIAMGGLWSLRNRGVGKCTGNFSFPMMKYGIPYVLLGMLSQGVRALDKTILANVNGLESAAIYGVGFKIATVILIVESTFNMAWGPVAMAIHKEKNSIDTYNFALGALAWILSVVFLLLSFFSEWLVSIIAPRGYAAAAFVAMIICVGFVMQSLAGVTSVGVELAKKPKLLIVSWSIGVGIATVLMVLLAPTMGTVGVALGVSVGLIVESIVRTMCAYAVYPFRFKLGSGFKPIFIAVCMIAVSNYFDQNYQIILKILFGMSFCVLGYASLRKNWLRA